ncbi:MAG TPA: PLP-dependent aminotransferase family protein [Gemmatimonadaceae bacterium]
MTRVSTAPELLAHLPIDRALATPLHQQVYDGFRRAILAGRLRSGQRVPSTRLLATELGMSRLPVLTAYEQLLHEGYFESRTGSGTFVCAAPPESRLHPKVRPGRTRSSTARRTRSAKERVPLVRDEGGVRPFRTSLPALDEFPQLRWARLLSRHAQRLTPTDLAYGDPAGIGSLRAAIASHLRTARAVNCEAEHVLITTGSQSALRLSAAVVLARGDCVAMEDPGYPGAHAAFAAAGVEIVPITVDDAGIDVAALAAMRQRIRAVYVTPSHQYPLGMSMSTPRRRALLDWAARHDAWLLEDDYDSEYRYVSRPLGALQGMDTRDRVIYIGTFSKVLYPSLRVGYVVVPASVRERFLDAREALDICSPTLYQLALADFLNDGSFARHLRRMRTIYHKRRDALLDGLARHCKGLLTVANADAGLHVTTFLTDRGDDQSLIREMRRHGLTATPLSSCYLGRARRQGLLLGFGGFDERSLIDATRTLGELIRATRRQSGKSSQSTDTMSHRSSTRQS